MVWFINTVSLSKCPLMAVWIISNLHYKECYYMYPYTRIFMYF